MSAARLEWWVLFWGTGKLLALALSESSGEKACCLCKEHTGAQAELVWWC